MSFFNEVGGALLGLPERTSEAPCKSPSLMRSTGPLRDLRRLKGVRDHFSGCPRERLGRLETFKLKGSFLNEERGSASQAA